MIQFIPFPTGKKSLKRYKLVKMSNKKYIEEIRSSPIVTSDITITLSCIRNGKVSSRNISLKGDFNPFSFFKDDSKNKSSSNIQRTTKVTKVHKETKVLEHINKSNTSKVNSNKPEDPPKIKDPPKVPDPPKVQD